MSTNKTENCHLHAWEAGDIFLRSEFNENFAAIDGILPQSRRLRVAVGSYTGVSATTQAIILGFQPEAVYVSCKYGGEQHNLFLQDMEGKYGSVTADGFTVSGVLNVQLNSEYPYNGQSINPYRYIAIGWEE